MAYDVVIVGACTAGTYFAGLLGKAGLKVLVIDKDTEENLCRRLEGIRSVSFTLIPMLVGTLIGNAIIKNTPQTDLKYDVYGHVIDVPQENLFLIAGFMVLLTLIPLYYAAKQYHKRLP